MRSLDDFFASLPTEEFEAFETELREVLINAAAKAKDLGLPGGRFPLQQWIDRRLGGEIRTTGDAQSQCEVALIGPEEPASDTDEATSFFQGLSDDSFSQEEEQLRDSIFDFLARWKKTDLAQVSDLSADVRVQACTRALLPSAVPLDQWMERRIGGEIEIHQDRGYSVIVVTPEARKIVAEKCQAQSKIPAPPLPPPPPPLQSKGASGGFASKGAKGGKPPMTPMSKEKWLQSLPADELTGDEVELRQALLDFLSAWRPGKGKGGASAPLLNEVLRDPSISRLRAALLPYNVPLQEWLEARIGGEIEVRANQKGQQEMVRRSAEAEAEPEPEQEDVGEILDALPQDALTDEELELRESVLELVSSQAMSLHHVSQHPSVLTAKRKFLPDEVPLRDWLDRRIGGEVEVTEDDRVRSRTAATEEEPPAAPPAREGKGKGKAKAHNGDRAQGHASPTDQENFFLSLPAEKLTDAEEVLRDAILNFLEHWTAEDRPPMARISNDPTIKQSRTFLPREVQLKDWIERRLSGELEVSVSARGIPTLGIRGDPDPEPAKRGAEAEWEAGGGKARKLGF